VKEEEEEEEKEEEERWSGGDCEEVRSCLCWNSWKSLEVRRCAAKTIKNEIMKKGARVS
jgi:hypothetical protein